MIKAEVQENEEESLPLSDAVNEILFFNIEWRNSET